MTLEAISWALHRRVGNGQLKATLVAIACLCRDGISCVRADLTTEANLSRKTINRHLRLLKFLGFIDYDAKSITIQNQVRS